MALKPWDRSMQKTQPVAAAASALAAAAIIGFADNFVVVIAETHGLWQFHIARTAIALPFLVVLALAGLGTLWPRSWAAVAARSVFVSLAIVIYFGCLAFLPISEVAAGLFTAPIWVILISVFGLGHRIGPVRIGAIAIGFLGVTLVLRPDAGALSVVSGVPVFAGLLYAISVILTRERCAEESALCLLGWGFVAMALWGGVMLAVLRTLDLPVPDGAEGFILRGWVAVDARFLSWIAALAVGALLGVGLLIRAYQIAEASFVSVFEFAILVFASVWAYVLRAETIDMLGMMGIALIILGGGVIAVRGQEVPR